ncbi:hypothetical protein T11_7980 [Trichinella zimbabwensis]|uniref:Uncharacterized protein n=1 Tax=Trichinella zimbabwensis TaxID=268475 RepID=A0A0V1G7D9_9BILA|nr:hypothetical protein T11_7980 [Trichinella zimbabwensis]
MKETIGNNKSTSVHHHHRRRRHRHACMHNTELMPFLTGHYYFLAE